MKKNVKIMLVSLSILVLNLGVLVLVVSNYFSVDRGAGEKEAAEVRRLVDSVKEFEGVISWVYDGDTVQVKSHGVKIMVRLWGIDTPEKKQPGGKAALWYLVKLTKRKKVHIVPVESGNYGRLIAKIYVNGKFVNLEMIKAGHAWWYERYSPDWTEGKAALAEAQNEKRGIWGASKPPVEPYLWRRKHKNKK